MTAQSLCASVGSLATKNKGLWKSKRSLARCGGEDFVAGLLFMASNPDWSRDPKRALLMAAGEVAHEAAKALQSFWRQSCQRREAAINLRAREAVAEYARTEKAASGPRSDPKKPIGARARAGSHERARPAGPTEQTCSERGWKSNPRPSPARGVPMNPLQAMKQRLAQQQHELEERRWQGRQEAEDARQARRTPASPEVSQAGCPSSARGAEVSPESSTPPEESAVEALLASLAADSRPLEREGQDAQDSTATAASTPSGSCGFAEAAGEAMPTPLELRKLREASKVKSEASPTASTGAPFLSAPLAATERLRDRLKKRESGKGEFRTPRPPAEAGTSQINWKERIEIRHKEAEEQQVQAEEEKQRTAERSTRRTDALRRVQERREQRHQEASGLEEGSPIQAIPP